MGPPPAPHRVRELAAVFQNALRSTPTPAHPALLAALTNTPEQLELLMALQPDANRWAVLKTLRLDAHPPDGVAALLDNLEFVQFWVHKSLALDGSISASVWTHACMGPSLRTLSWLLENHSDSIFTGMRAQDMEGVPEAALPAMTLAECLRHKKLVARGICYILDAIEHAPKVYVAAGREERAARAEAAIRMVRDYCRDAMRRSSGPFRQVPEKQPVFSKTPLRHAALYGSPGCFETILESTQIANPSTLFDALFPHFERNSFRDNNFRFSMAFLRFLHHVVPAAERNAVVVKYLPRAKLYFKDVAFFRYLVANDFLSKDANLVSYVISIGPHISWKATYPRPLLRKQLFRCLAFACGHSGASSSDLAFIVEAVKKQGPLLGARGLVRLALFYGADPHVPAVMDAVRGPPPAEGAPRGPLAYQGFAEDVRSAKAWARWMENNSLGNLPPELAREVLLWHWESFVELPAISV